MMHLKAQHCRLHLLLHSQIFNASVHINMAEKYTVKTIYCKCFGVF